MGKNKVETGVVCPLIGSACVEHRCAWYTNVQGLHPQTGETVNQWSCAVAWLPVLVVDQTQQVRQHGAAAEQGRNALLTLGLAQRLRSLGEPDAEQLDPA